MEKNFNQLPPLLIIGFGNQAQAWAANLQNSKMRVAIGIRENSPSIVKIKEQGLELIDLDNQDLKLWGKIALLIPDDQHASWLLCYSKKISPGTQIIYAHGFSVTSSSLVEKYPQFSHTLLAPKAIARELRSRYLSGQMLSGVMCAESESEKNYLRQLALALGFTHGPFEASFDQETTADLLSEQVILCGGLPYLALLCFQALREKNIPAELAYLECWFELKLIVDTMTELGPEKFFSVISPNALLGAEKAQKILFDDTFKTNIKTLLTDIRSGGFSKQVEKEDFSRLKEKVQSFWRDQELTRLDDQFRLRDSVLNKDQ